MTGRVSSFDEMPLLRWRRLFFMPFVTPVNTKKVKKLLRKDKINLVIKK